jgi:uncharacterized protein (TIGR00297 family)
MTGDTSLPRLSGAEWSRKLTHIAAFAPAFLLPWLGIGPAILMAVILFLGNAFVLPRAMPFLYRAEEPGAGALEIVLYPAAVLACLLAWSGGAGPRPWYMPAAAAWFCLAVVDACIGIGCRALRMGPRLPWNARKPAIGAMAGVAVAGAIAYALAAFLAARNALPTPSPYDWIALAIILGAAGLAETAWFGVADNLVVPFTVCLLAALLPSPLFRGHPDPFPWVTFVIPMVFGVAAYAGRLLTAGGALLGAAMAFALMAAEPRLFLFLGGFFLLANLATRFGYVRKHARGIAEQRGGRRGADQVFGAMGVAAWMTPLVHGVGSRLDTGVPRSILLICAAPFVAKTMDTVASEIGKAVGGPTISLRTFRGVPPGSEGGVSLAGTLWGLGAAAALSLGVFPLAWPAPPGELLRDAGVLVLIAFAANVFESFWGEWAAKRGMDHGPHTNFLMTLFAALAARVLFR